MRLVHDTKGTLRALQGRAQNVIEVFSDATSAQAVRIVRILRAWNLRYYRTGQMRDGWEYTREIDGVTFLNLVDYSGFNDRDSEAESVVFDALDFNLIADEVADG